MVNHFKDMGIIKQYLKLKFNSLTTDYSNQGNMVDVIEFMESNMTSFAQEHKNKILVPIYNLLIKNGVNSNEIKVGTIVDDTWGWRMEDIHESGIPGSTLWVYTKNSRLMEHIYKKFSPNEFDIRNGRYRLWWD